MDSAKALVKLGYPIVAPRLAHMLEWTADANWPVASILIPFLRTLGEPIVPHVTRILEGRDLVFKYFCISNIIGSMHPDIAEHFRSILEGMADNPTQEEREEELHEVAQAAMEDLGWRQCEKFK